MPEWHFERPRESRPEAERGEKFGREPQPLLDEEHPHDAGEPGDARRDIDHERRKVGEPHLAPEREDVAVDPVSNRGEVPRWGGRRSRGHQCKGRHESTRSQWRLVFSGTRPPRLPCRDRRVPPVKPFENVTEGCIIAPPGMLPTERGAMTCPGRWA